MEFLNMYRIDLDVQSSNILVKSNRRLLNLRIRKVKRPESYLSSNVIKS